MRAAAIFGPGNVQKHFVKFQRFGDADWIVGAPEHADQADVAVIFGGDGTIHRHLSTLVDLQAPVLVVPCGSGNDFARALGLRNIGDSLTAWHKFTSTTSNVRAIDLGTIERLPQSGQKAAEPAAPHSHYFCCVAGVGLDCEIARRANDLPKWIRAHGGYALSAPREFLRFAPFPMKVSREGRAANGFRPTILAAVANAPTYGGGMKIAPRARLDDGKLDLCVVRGMDVFRLFCLFPTVYFGRHLGFEEVEYEQTENVRIETERPFDVYADGEFVCQTPVKFGVAQNALQVIVPA
jgi:diacylglycerol kinase (ATP)